MATSKTNAQLVAALAVQELELTLLREQRACEDWELLDTMAELKLMGRIAKRTKWPSDYQPLVDTFGGALKRVQTAIETRDTTRLGAAQTKLEHAVAALRDHFYR